MAVAVLPAEPLQLLNLAPRRSIAELLAEPIRYVAARHSTETALPPGLEPVNTMKPQRPQQQQQPPLESLPVKDSPATSQSKSDGIKGPAADDVGQRVVSNQDFIANWPAGITGAAHGLNNNGNTCYLNATLQGLLHLPAMVAVIPRMHNTHQCERKATCALCKLIALTQGAFKNRNHSVMPAGILNLLKKIAPHFRRFAQEDAHEFLRLLLDACVEADVSPKQIKQNPKLKDTSAVHKLFGGRFCSRVHCKKCGYNSDTFDTFLDVSLPLTRNTARLEDCFDVFTEADQLSGAYRYKCEKCKTLVNATKSLSINKVPYVLTVHIKRFSPLRQKISMSIAYPETLNLEPWMTESGQNSYYRLDSIICHSGSSANSGHYYSYVRTANGDWYRQDDSRSSRVSPQERSGLFSMRQAYVLMYSRVDRGSIPSSELTTSKTSRSVDSDKSASKASDSAKMMPPSGFSSNSQANLGKRKQHPDSEEVLSARPANRPRVISDVGPSSSKKPANPFSMHQQQSRSPPSRPQSAQGHYASSHNKSPTSPARLGGPGEHGRRMSMPSLYGPRDKKMMMREPAPANAMYQRNHKSHSKHTYGHANRHQHKKHRR